MIDDKWILLIGFVVVGCAETFRPLHSLPTSTARRWTSNLGLYALAWVVQVAAFPAAGVLLASTVRVSAWGTALRAHLPYSVQFLLAFAILDFSSYALHRFFHAFGFTWRVHQVHHSETEMDLTTGLRFHPLEALASQALWLFTIALIAAPPEAVAASAAAIILEDFFQHANVRFPERVDRWLRLLVVTPAIHRVHHSMVVADHDTNFGTIFTVWDRIFRTYREPTGEFVHCGLEEVPAGSALDPLKLVWLPFRRRNKSGVSTKAAQFTA